jgi:hypothetical protein
VYRCGILQTGNHAFRGTIMNFRTTYLHSKISECLTTAAQAIQSGKGILVAQANLDMALVYARQLPYNNAQRAWIAQAQEACNAIACQ